MLFTEHNGGVLSWNQIKDEEICGTCSEYDNRILV
jgi:hypothetical protein